MRVLKFYLFEQTISFGIFLIQDAVVTVTEGDQSSSSAEKQDEDQGWKVKVQSVEIENAEFSYIRVYIKTYARTEELNIKKIFSKSSELSTFAPECDHLWRNFCIWYYGCISWSCFDFRTHIVV
jgi:hypothetical protein